MRPVLDYVAPSIPRSLICTCTVPLLTSHARPHSRQARLAAAAQPVPATAAGRSTPPSPSWLPSRRWLPSVPLAAASWRPPPVPLAATLPPLVAAHAARSFLLVPRRRPRWQPPALLAASPPPLAAPHADCRPAAGRRPRRRPPPRRRLPPPTLRAAGAPVAGCRHRRSPALVVVSAPSFPATPQAGSRPLCWLVPASTRSRFTAIAGFRPAADSGPSRWLPPCRRLAPPTLPDAAAPAAGCRRRCLWPLPWLPPPCCPRPLTLAAASIAGHRRCWLPPSGRPPLSTLAATPSLTAPFPAASPLAAPHPAGCRAAAPRRPH